jgi:putative oxidoreductase
MRIAKEVALWVVCAFLAYVFLKAGAQKFVESSGWSRAFHFWGFPLWFRILVGATEIAAALLLLYPRTASLGALMIVVVMLGAMATHIVTNRPKQVTSEILPFSLATGVFFGRRKRMFSLQSINA